MPQKPTTIKCVQCNHTESPMWRLCENGQICNSCYEENKKQLLNELEPETPEPAGNENTNSNNGEVKKLRKSTRTTRYKSKASNNTGTTVKNITKGRSRRNIFKKPPIKAPVIPATTTFSDSLFHNGSYIQVGDIVSISDFEDNTYYAQIRGLLVDTYCEKSAFITWLIPTQASPPPNERFEPSTYLIGPEEDFSRKLSCMEFVMHAPSNYYHNKNTPYPAIDCDDTSSKHAGFIWTNLYLDEAAVPKVPAVPPTEN